MQYIPYKSVIVANLALIGIAVAVPPGLLDGLGDENYMLREKSEQELAKWAKKTGEDGLNELNELKRKTQSPEVQSRLDNVISGVTIYKAIPGTRGFMGISMTPALGSAVITVVSPNTPAEKAGLQANDRIIGLDKIDLTRKNNHAAEAMNFLRAYVQSKKAGEKLTVKIQRDGEILTKVLKLASYDDMIQKLRPLGNGFNDGNQVIPRQMKLNPRQLKQDQKQLLEMNLQIQKQLLERKNIPELTKKRIKLQHERLQKKLDQLNNKLNLEKKDFLKE